MYRTIVADDLSHLLLSIRSWQGGRQRMPLQVGQLNTSIQAWLIKSKASRIALRTKAQDEAGQDQEP